jgi:hypothetical protein
MQKIKIPKKTKGEFRTIYIPDENTKKELRSLLSSLENNLKAMERNGNIPNNVIHGFVSKRSAVTNAIQHIGFNYTLSMDLEDFFDNVKVSHVEGLIPKEIIEKVFVDGSPRQGLPTSPLVCNIAALKIDIAFLKFLKKGDFKAVYTRYADDISISFNDKNLFELFKSKMKEITRRAGFKIKEAKTRLQSQSYGNREVTGVMVGEKGISVSRKYRRRMRATLHQEKNHIFDGMSEWSLLRLPKEKESKPLNHNYLTMKILKAHKRCSFSRKYSPQKLEETRSGEFLITNDLGYFLGMSDLADGWTSCYRKAGVNKNAPMFFSYFKSSVGLLLSEKETEYFGLKRNMIRARCIILTFEDGRKLATQFYGANDVYKNRLKEFMKEQGISMESSEFKGDGKNYVVGKAPVNFKKRELYGGIKAFTVNNGSECYSRLRF